MYYTYFDFVLLFPKLSVYFVLCFLSELFCCFSSFSELTPPTPQSLWGEWVASGPSTWWLYFLFHIRTIRYGQIKQRCDTKDTMMCDDLVIFVERPPRLCRASHQAICVPIMDYALQCVLPIWSDLNALSYFLLRAYLFEIFRTCQTAGDSDVGVYLWNVPVDRFSFSAFPLDPSTRFILFGFRLPRIPPNADKWLALPLPLLNYFNLDYNAYSCSVTTLFVTGIDFPWILVYVIL